MLLIGLTGSIATGKSTVASILAAPPYCLPFIDADLLARQVVAPGTRGYAEIVAYFGGKLGMEDLFLDEQGKWEGEVEASTSTSASAHDAVVPSRAGSTSSFSSTMKTKNNKNKDPTPTLRPLNRAALGRRVFGSSPSALRDRKVLNRITHPRVRLAMLRLILYYYILGHWAVVLDIPLLYESGLDIFCGGVMMVAVRDPEVQMRRLLERDREKGLTRQEAENRVASQKNLREKVGRTAERGVGRGAVVWNDGGLEELRKEVLRGVLEIAGYVRGGTAVGEVEAETETETEEKPNNSGSIIKKGDPLQTLQLSTHPNRWWTWWLWASPWAAVLVAGAEVWRGWQARRRWEGRGRAGG